MMCANKSKRKMMEQLFIGIGIGIILGIGIMLVLILVYIVIRKNKTLKKVQEINTGSKEVKEQKHTPSKLTSHDNYIENSFLHPDDGLGKMERGVQ
jgi:hypothetical protein